jgi:hypothetical protein
MSYTMVLLVVTAGDVSGLAMVALELAGSDGPALVAAIALWGFTFGVLNVERPDELTDVLARHLDGAVPLKVAATSAAQEGLTQLTDALDRTRQHLARLQKSLGRAAHADTGRGAGEDDVAR